MKAESKRSVITLADARERVKFVVLRTTTEEMTCQAMRFGIGEGAEITVEKSIPGGPVIVSRNHLEIAIGRELAKAIEVIPAGTAHDVLGKG